MNPSFPEIDARLRQLKEAAGLVELCAATLARW
jgi:hypothetical protein